MATLRIYNTAGSQLGQSLTIPDTWLPRIQQAFGGATTGATANLFLAFIKQEMAPVIKKRILDTKLDLDWQPVRNAQDIAKAAQVTEAAALDVDLA